MQQQGGAQRVQNLSAFARVGGEHAGARAVSARNLAGLGGPLRAASGYFEDALALRKAGFDRVKVLDRVGLAAALSDEGEPDQGAGAAHQALDDAARIDSTLVASGSTRCWTRPARTGRPQSTRYAAGHETSPPPGRPRSPPENNEHMGKHRRPGPPNQPSRAVPRTDSDDPLAAYSRRRQPPMDIYQRHRPVHGGASHLRPDEPYVLEEWDGFTYQVVSTAPGVRPHGTQRPKPRPRALPASIRVLTGEAASPSQSASMARRGGYPNSSRLNSTLPTTKPTPVRIVTGGRRLSTFCWAPRCDGRKHGTASGSLAHLMDRTPGASAPRHATFPSRASLRHTKTSSVPTSRKRLPALPTRRGAPRRWRCIDSVEAWCALGPLA
ncbi:hypothetical protein GCM10010278_84800 [Streptomyces melanogenes]|nr:hypothetical protein GCM10010278_84800 [Streptomyces melanogenes]